MIPGIYLPFRSTGPKVLLLLGPSGVGKTMYCRQFLLEGLLKGDKCIFISTDLSRRQFNLLFSNVETRNILDRMDFINPCDDISLPYNKERAISGKRLANAILSALEHSLEIRGTSEKNNNNNDVGSTSKPVRLVIDSMTHTFLLLGERMLIEFVMDLTRVLKGLNVTALLALTASSGDQRMLSDLGSIVDGNIEMRLKEDSNDMTIRSIRVRHLKGVYYDPKWTNFKISSNGTIIFRNAHSSSLGTPAEVTCALCAKPIIGTPFVESDFIFDSKECMEMYHRLESAYGSKISDTGLPSVAFHASFFFIDIVGLSDPTLSVKRQVQKIQILNELIHSCDSFRKASTGKKVILPTGDGTAIGFLSNPEIPLELSIQLHHKMRAYNQQKYNEELIGVRIGLGSGPVFTVSDLNNVQNIWGPGIILARRVMDAGDNGHILIAEKLAEELISLKDEYRSVINLISNKYKLKHGQEIKLYSAYSNDFGNPRIPTKVSSYD
ncbi:MAG TPA: ATPase domain-containing protein [Nitrososphaera sp.]|nr:ATPase domain-containing protein [Nitrososphaera sp.]